MQSEQILLLGIINYQALQHSNPTVFQLDGRRFSIFLNGDSFIS